jgi:peptide/nickel transport system substrate-binding protein
MLALAGCDRRPDDVPVVASVIAEPGAKSPSPAFARVLRGATAEGLVRFDASGGIEPGLAERWIVIDDGKSIIFRLREGNWTDGKPIVAEDVVAALKRAIAPERRNPITPYLSAVDEIVAMTPQVIEVRLSRPRPDLLKLFAQPELSITAPGSGEGAGPMRQVETRWPGVLLKPVAAPEDDEAPAERFAPQDYVRLRDERASAAILRFAAKRSDLVLGGTFLNWPLVPLTDVAPANVRLDPAAGLFGLLIANRTGFLAERDNRAAIALALDRAAIAAAFRDDWQTTETILPEQLDSAAPPAQPDWGSVPETERLEAARARLALSRGRTPPPAALKVALPDGPGATVLFTQIALALRRIGLDAERVALEDRGADLRLIDRVAPYDSARWYLRAACQPCALPIAQLIADVRHAPDVTSRAQMLAQADSALTADVAYIPLARPFRWSLVATRLRAWSPSPRAIHPLNHLRREPN